MVGVLFQIENCRHRDELVALIPNLAKDLWQKQVPASLRRAFGVWISRVVARSLGVELTPSEFEDFSEVQIMLATRMKQWEQELIEQTMAKGIEQGIEQGVLTGEATLLRRQLQLRFGTLPTWASDRLAQANRDILEQWGLKVLDAKTLAEIFD